MQIDDQNWPKCYSKFQCVLGHDFEAFGMPFGTPNRSPNRPLSLLDSHGCSPSSLWYPKFVCRTQIASPGRLLEPFWGPMGSHLVLSRGPMESHLAFSRGPLVPSGADFRFILVSISCLLVYSVSACAFNVRLESPLQ